jgi:hypothetical protein
MITGGVLCLGVVILTLSYDHRRSKGAVGMLIVLPKEKEQPTAPYHKVDIHNKYSHFMAGILIII